jgi:hypothetical protein
MRSSKPEKIKSFSFKHIAHTPGGKSLIIIWWLIIVIFTTLAVDGYFRDEFLGNIYFSFLPIAILVNLSIVISCYYKKNCFQIIKTSWILLCIMVIVSIIVITVVNSNTKDADLLLVYVMLTFSFPSSYLVAGVLSGLSYLSYYKGVPDLLDFGNMNFYVYILFTWLSFFVAGYLQWFKLLPLIIEKWRKRK